MKNMLLIADDFTGANDSGIKVVKRGYKTNINLSDEIINDSKISIIDTETRNVPGDQAYNKLNKIIKNIEDIDKYLILYKKIDSTLRGNLKEEYEAVLNNLKPKYVIFAPAYPDLERITLDGLQYVKGKRVINSEFASDPVKPVLNDDIRSILSKHTTHHALKEIRNNLDIKPGLNTFDCELYEDLMIIARKSLELEEKVLYIGSAGLCDAIFDELIIKRPSVGIVGSLSNKNKEMIQYCSKMGIKTIEININDYINGNVEKKFVSLDNELKNNKNLIITTNNSESYKSTMDYINYNNLDRDKLFSELINKISNHIINQEISGVMTTGGTTSIEFLRSIDAISTELMDEIEPGVVMSRIQGLDKKIYLVTKAGEFGDKKTIYNSLNEIRRKSI